MNRKMEQLIDERVMTEVRKVLQEASAPIYVLHPCDRSELGIYELTHRYGEVPNDDCPYPPDVRRASGEAVDDYNMASISPVSSDRYASNVYNALAAYITEHLSLEISSASDRVKCLSDELDEAEGRLESLRFTIQVAWTLAKKVADKVRYAIEEYSDASATDIERSIGEIDKLLSDAGRRSDGTDDCMTVANGWK